MGYKHITHDETAEIEKLIASGFRNCDIAEKVGRSESAVGKVRRGLQKRNAAKVSKAAATVSGDDLKTLTGLIAVSSLPKETKMTIISAFL
jgi:IS30 family transposase